MEMESLALLLSSPSLSWLPVCRDSFSAKVINIIYYHSIYIGHE